MHRIETFRGLVEGLFRDDFCRFQGLWVEEHLRLMKSLRQYFRNDLDKIMIIAAIGQQQLRDTSSPKRTYAPSSDGKLLGDPARFTNVDRLSAATGIPRESVRRKVNELIESGWVVRIGSRALAVHPRAAVDMQPATLTVFDVLDRMFAEFAVALVERGELRIERPKSDVAKVEAARRKADN
jgi:hypothetical protein